MLEMLASPAPPLMSAMDSASNSLSAGQSTSEYSHPEPTISPSGLDQGSLPPILSPKLVLMLKGCIPQAIEIMLESVSILTF